mgnify:FL=1
MNRANVCELDSLPFALTVAEAASVLRIGRSKSYELVRCGKLRSIRIDKQIRVPKQAILDFMAAN